MTRNPALRFAKRVALGKGPVARIALAYVVRGEGGQMTSSTLRTLLSGRYGVDVGMHSYGSLLIPGRADRFTSIGNYVSVGQNCRRIGASHPLDQPSMHPYWYGAKWGFVNESADVVRTPCRIEHDAWLGANVTILPGCKRIGVGSVVGAGSIVTHDVPDFSIVAGNPAREIDSRLTPSQRARILADQPWCLKPADYDRYLRQFSTP